MRHFTPTTVFSLLASLAFSPACAEQRRLSQGCSVKSSFADGIEPGSGESVAKEVFGNRTVRISLPEQYSATEPVPLIVALHDRNMGAEEFEKMAGLSDPRLNKDMVVVYPEAAVEHRWQSDFAAPKAVNDIAFLTNLLDHLGESLCVDLDRVYMAGLGTGAGLAHLLACDMHASRKIAAYALVNAAIPEALMTHEALQDETNLLWFNEMCRPGRLPIKLLDVHSGENEVYEYWGNKEIEGRKTVQVVSFLVEWAMRNGCGIATAAPEPWRDGMAKTELETGYILEGAIGNGSVLHASYHCWRADESVIDEIVEEALLEKDLPPAAELKKMLEEAGKELQEKAEEEARQEEERNAALKMPKEGEDGGAIEEEKTETRGHEDTTSSGNGAAESATPSTESEPQSSPAERVDSNEEKKAQREARKAELKRKQEERAKVEGEPLADITDEEMDKTTIVEHYLPKGELHGWPKIAPKTVESQTEGEPPVKLPGFDTSETVLQWFGRHSLSDQLIPAPRGRSSVSEKSRGQIDEYLQGVQRTIEEAKKLRDEKLGKRPASEEGGQEEKGEASPLAESKKGTETVPEEEPEEPQPSIKDEL